MTGEDGQRTASRVYLELRVAHDGDPEVLAGHLAVEVDALVERWGCTLLDSQWGVTVVHDGDGLSRELPVIRPAPPEDADRWL